MNDKLKEKLSDAELSQKMGKEIIKIEEELFLKDLQYAADILEIPIDDKGTTICIKREHTRFLVLMYGILQYQILRLKNTQNNILNDIKKRNSKLAEDLTNLK